jgi:hypothetical protein
VVFAAKLASAGVTEAVLLFFAVLAADRSAGLSLPQHVRASGSARAARSRGVKILMDTE